MRTDADVAQFEVGDSLEALLAQHSTRGRAVYVCLLALIAAAMITPFVISVDLTVRGAAMLRPLSERQSLRAASEGVIARIAVARDDRVRAGDTILVLRAQVVELARAASRSALNEQQVGGRDLRALLNMDTSALLAPPPRLALERSRAIAAEAAIEWRQLTIRVEQAEQGRDRLRQLAQRGFAAPAEVGNAELELRHARETRTLAFEQRRAGWAADLAVAAERARELGRELAARQEEQAAHAIVAPIAGAIEELAPLAPGSTVRPGDAIATISPDDSLLAEVLVLPRDIGWVRPGMAVRLLVEGYDVQEWGAVEGVVAVIATDYTVVNEEPLFRVRVQIPAPTLRRADGRVVALRKGLRGQARFLAGRRKLSQLLLHRAREWMDPSGLPAPKPAG